MSEPTERPTPPPLPTLEQVPEELRPLKRWVGWRAVYDENKKKWKKPPHSPVTGEGIGAVEKWAEHWLTFEEARAGVVKHKLDGVGFVFKDGDGYVGIDFDDCRVDGKNHSVVDSWLKWLPTYAEVSPSGTGVHAIGKAKIVKSLTATVLPNADDAKVEIYNQGRYFTFTGQQLGKIFTIGDFQVGTDRLLQYLGADRSQNPGEIAGEQQRPMSKLTARRIHQDNLVALRNAMMGQGNPLLNTAAFFAGRAFAVGAFEQTEEQLKAEILKIVTEEWQKPHERHGAEQTIESGWGSGVENPILLLDDKFPQLTELMEEFNKEFYVVEDYGGKCRVCWEKAETFVRGKSIRLVAQSFNDFRNRFIHERIQVSEKLTADDPEPIYEDKGSAWLEHRHRNQYREVVFLPNVITPSKTRNLWRGFAYDPKKGDCSLYLAHVRDNICLGDRVKYRYTIGWMANAVRNPGEQGHVALVVQGKKGVGKNVFAEGFSTLWGSHGIVVMGDHAVTSNFNAHLRDKCVLVADEVFFAGDPRQDRVLKGLVTGFTIQIEAKGVDKETCPNLLHLIIIGNDDRLVNATFDERRYFVTKCGSEHKDDHAYFAAIQRQLTNGGYAALLYHLLYEVDLTGFNVRNVPKTAELVSSMAFGLKPVEKAWYELLHSGQLPQAQIQKDGTAWLRSECFIQWAREKRRWEFTDEQVGLLLKMHPRGEKDGMGFKKTRPKNGPIFWVIPTLADARKIWDEKRFPVEWPQPDQSELMERGDWVVFEV
jgi:hypothetical protein